MNRHLPTVSIRRPAFATISRGPARPRWRLLSRGSRQVLLLGTGLMLVAALGLGLLVWQMHRVALTQARQNVHVLGIAVAEQTSRSIQGADLVLQDLWRQIAAQNIASVAEFKTRLNREDLSRFLKDRADFLPQIDALTIIAADGKLVNYSRGWPVPPTDLSDRDYLEYFAAHDTPDAIVSKPVQNRGNGTWTTYLVRRVNAPSGAFLGLVLAALDLDYFKKFFQTLAPGAGTVITLLRRDGTMLASYPPAEAIGDVIPPASAWHAVVARGADVLDAPATKVRASRFVAVEPLPDYPLVIDVGIDKMAAIADWAWTAKMIGLAALFAAVCVTLLIREQLLQFGRLERSEALLANRNAALEASDQALREQAAELSARRATEAEQAQTLQAALRHMNQGILMVGADRRVVVCNERAAALLDLPPALLAASAQLRRADRPSAGARASSSIRRPTCGPAASTGCPLARRAMNGSARTAR